MAKHEKIVKKLEDKAQALRELLAVSRAAGNVDVTVVEREQVISAIIEEKKRTRRTA